MARKELLKKMKKPEAQAEEELLLDEELPSLEEDAEDEELLGSGGVPEEFADYISQLEAVGYKVIAPDEAEEEALAEDEALLDEEEEEF